MTATTGTASRADIDAALALLDRLGVSPQQLVVGSATRQVVVPTFTDYVTRVSSVVSDGSKRVYQTYWRRIEHEWGTRRLNEVTATDITELVKKTRATAVQRRNTRGGRTAAEHLIGALRCLYKYAVDDGYILEADNPASRVAKPRRLASTRHGLQPRQLAQINHVAATTGNDPDLDCLLLRLHTETACRRAGALGLRLCDLDVEQCLIQLREKGETVRWQPVSPTLMRYLTEHAQERGSTDLREPLLRYRNGMPLTVRRYDHLWERIGALLPWVRVQGVSTHWLRHTTLTWVERNFGYAVARAYAGHEGKSDAGTTITYIRADVYEVATALAALTGEHHPLAPAQTER